jgi:CheY-like chemotaxis protein
VHILVVEDHANTLRVLELFLHALGHRTDLARNVQEALALAAGAEEQFDLLLSDLQLPDGDGWKLLWRLRKAGRKPQRAIALSGWGSEEDVAESQRAGYQAHLVKPLKPEILKAALAEAAEAIHPSR